MLLLFVFLNCHLQILIVSQRFDLRPVLLHSTREDEEDEKTKEVDGCADEEDHSPLANRSLKKNATEYYR